MLLKKKIGFWTLLVIVAFLFHSCKKDTINDANSIIGKWELKSHTIYSNGNLTYKEDYQADGSSYIYQYYSDNTYTLRSSDRLFETGIYKLESGKLFRSYKTPGVETYSTLNCTITKRTLTLSDSGTDVAGKFEEYFVYSKIF